jgi:hypothetical protein
MIARITAIAFLTAPASLFASGGWASSLAGQIEHNFGAVERGAQLSHQFTLTNNTGKEVRIKNVSPSCHCVSPMVTDYTIPPGGSTVIDARMNTSSFLGSKTVTITVSFDKPRRGELQLRVSAVSGGGPNITASEIDFGSANVGQKAEKKLILEFLGGADRKIEGVEFNKERVTASFREIERKSDRVRYELALALAENLPIGLLEEKVRVRTNDPKASEVMVTAKAKIEGSVTVVPDSFKLDDLSPGARITKNVIIKSQTPFHVTQVNNTLGMFAVKSGPDDKTVQMVTITVTVPADLGLLSDHLEFQTNLPDAKPIVLPVVKNEKKVASSTKTDKK